MELVQQNSTFILDLEKRCLSLPFGTWKRGVFPRFRSLRGGQSVCSGNFARKSGCDSMFVATLLLGRCHAVGHQEL
jgi:hypothetical protein